jgi:allantoicase
MTHPTTGAAFQPEFATLPDLASRRVGGAAVAANDELFADRENLIKPEPPRFAAYTFGSKGQIMDGWESRRRREPGHDWAIVRLGLPGAVRGVVVDTSFFTGNYPPEISVEGTAVEGYPSAAELADAEWSALVPRAAAKGDTANAYPVECSDWITHVRLCQYPDGGVARLRVHGEPVPDPRLLAAGRIDLAALANGAAIAGCSNMHYSSPTNLISPGEARVMGEGWETARRRDDGNDWVEVRLAGPGVIRLAELDTSYFVGNAPGWAALRGYDERIRGRLPNDADWIPLLPKTALQPDTPHRLRLRPAAEVTHVRLDIYPDGGMARVRLNGDLAPQGRQQLALRWFNMLPDRHAREVLSRDGDLTSASANRLLANRPLVSVDDLPAALRQAVGS